MAETKEEVVKRVAAGKKSLKDGEHHDAIICFTKALYLDKTSADVYVLRGQTYIELGDLKSAASNFRKAVAFDPANRRIVKLLATTLLNVAIGQLEDEQIEAAKLTLSDALTLDDRLSMAWVYRGCCSAALGDFSAALHDMDQAVGLSAKNADILIAKARIHLMCSDFVGASTEIESALAISPDHPVANELLENIQTEIGVLSQSSSALLLAGQVDKAIDSLNKALSLCRDEAEKYPIFLRRGMAYRTKGEFESAILDFELCLKGTNDPSALHQITLTHNDCGLALFKRKRFQDAIPHFNQAIRGEPTEATFYVNRGDAFRGLQNFAEALGNFDKAIKLAGALPHLTRRIGMVHNDIGSHLFNIGALEEATEEFTRAINQCPDVWQFFLNRANSYYYRDAYDEAYHDLRVILDVYPLNEAAREKMEMLTRVNGYVEPENRI